MRVLIIVGTFSEFVQGLQREFLFFFASVTLYGDGSRVRFLGRGRLSTDMVQENGIAGHRFITGTA